MEKKLDRASRRDAKTFREISKLALPYSVRNGDQPYVANDNFGGGGGGGGTRQSSRRGAAKVDYTYSGYDEALKNALRE